MNKLTVYMKEDGFELSQEETCLMLFNNGENPKRTRWSVIELQTEY